MQDLIYADQLRGWLSQGDFDSLRTFCISIHPENVAEALAQLSSEQIWQALSQLPLSDRAAVFTHLDEPLQLELATTLRRDKLASLIVEMPPDERVDLLKGISEDKREALLPAVAQAEREDIRRLSAYSEGTAGAVMTSEYATVSPSLTVAEAIAKLRQEAPDKETIYYAYVVDEARKLIGFVSLKDLILARPEKKVKDIMHSEVISAQVTESQEEAARKIQKYDFIALPVVNGNDALVGIITYDDALDILNEEFTEDMKKFMAITGEHEAGPYLRESAWKHFKHRSGWVLVLALLGMVSGFIVHRFEALLLQFSILATFMPMLVDAGGNTGSQSATLIVRALALKEISSGDAFHILFKELKVSLLLGALLAGVAFGRVFLFGTESGIPRGCSPTLIGAAVAAALAIQIICSTLIGAFLPLVAARLRADPAVVASPALTTIVDITGLLIFFTTVKIILGI